MKPASVIFLIVSAVLIVAGIVTCHFAADLNTVDGTPIIHPAGEDLVFTYDFGKDQINTVKMVLKEAEVNIIGESENSYIELINFPAGSYEFSSAHPTLSVINDWDGPSLSGIASFVSEINGLCGLVNYLNLQGSEKVVNLYIAPESTVDGVTCDLSEGTVRMEKCNMSRDYNIKIEDGEHYINGTLMGSGKTAE